MATKRLDQRMCAVSVDRFKALLMSGAIRPASLEDVNGTHHTRNLYRHPNTDQWFVSVAGDDHNGH